MHSPRLGYETTTTLGTLPATDVSMMPLLLFRPLLSQLYPPDMLSMLQSLGFWPPEVYIGLCTNVRVPAGPGMPGGGDSEKLWRNSVSTDAPNVFGMRHPGPLPVIDR